MDQATYEAARTRYHNEAAAFAEAIIARLSTELIEAIPTATKLHVHGEYDEEMELKVRIALLELADGTLIEPTDEVDGVDGWEEMVDELDSDYLLYLAGVTGEDYLGNHVIDLSA
jgi:hypothetical protein